MKKVFVADVLVIDVCPICQGTWFDKAELDFLKQKARDMNANVALSAALIGLWIPLFGAN
jgi:Zn-finger nucleic acid-binding protein